MEGESGGHGWGAVSVVSPSLPHLMMPSPLPSPLQGRDKIAEDDIYAAMENKVGAARARARGG